MSIKQLLIVLFGASGWGVAIVKLFTDLREDARKARKDEREERENELKVQEAKKKTAELLAPFIREVNGSDYLKMSSQIQKNTKIKDDGSPLSENEMRQLRNYPGKLEEMGALMLAGRFSRSEIYDLFYEEIMACHSANFLWEGEDMHYWKVFTLLVTSMKQEKAVRDQLVTKRH